MKKKALMGVVLLAIVATGVFAQGFSMAAGGGALFDWSAIGNGLDFQYPGYGGFKADVQNLSFGGYGFIDATYAELDVSFAYGKLKLIDNDKWGVGVDAWNRVRAQYGDLFEGSELQLGFTLLGKYPIGLGGFTFFPLLGADYNMILSGWDKNGNAGYSNKDMNQFGLLAGAGLDFPFSSALFLRVEAMFHLRFPVKIFNDMVKLYNGTGEVNAKAPFGIGPRIQIGVGYRYSGGSGSASSSSSSSRSGKYMLVNADALNVRSGPSADAALVGTLPRNTRVEVLDRSGTWWKIKSGKIQGYVNSSYLKAE